VTENDDTSGVSCYRQVAAILEREMRDGTWLPGKVIPAQTQLAQRFGIAKATAAHAHLAERGFVVAVPGTGMVVTRVAAWPPVTDG
jgi:DNA-binding GntR family transcriptional regulator